MNRQVYPEGESITQKSSRSSSPLKPSRIRSNDLEFTNLNESHAPSVQINMDSKKEISDKMLQSFRVVRVDGKGIPIVRGGSKLHSIRFKKILTQVIIVENWKIHNFGTEEDENTCPICVIF